MYFKNLILSHGHIPENFLKATLVPIPKNIRLGCNVSSNYRAIALSFKFGKVLDKTLLNMQRNIFNTNNIQFGFKQNSSKVIYSSMVIETIDYYVNCNYAVYLLLIDASKAFDRLCHHKLFDLLM